MHGLYLYNTIYTFTDYSLLFTSNQVCQKKDHQCAFFFNRFTYKLAAKGAGYTSHEIEILPPPPPPPPLANQKKTLHFLGFLLKRPKFFFFFFSSLKSCTTRNNQRSIIDRKCLCSSPTHSLKRSMLLFLLCGVVGTGKDMYRNMT